MSLFRVLSFSVLFSFSLFDVSAYNVATFETNATRPNLPANRILNSTLKSFKSIQSEKAPEASGDFIDSLSLGLDYLYTDFDDDTQYGSGDVEETVFSLSGLVAENTTLAFSYSHIDYRYTSPSPDFEIEAHGYDLSLHHSLNENYGLGAYTFYQMVDIKNNNSNSFTYGFGGLFTTYHDLDLAVLSTSSSLTLVDYDYGYDTVFLTMADLSRQLNDWCTLGLFASWTDSLRSDPDFDNNYWLLGVEMRFDLDQWNVSIGFESAEDLDDYEGETVKVSVNYLF